MTNYKKILGYLFPLGIWSLVYFLIKNPIIFPSPLDILRGLLSLLRSASFYSYLFASLSKIFLALTFSMIFSILTSYLAFRYELRDFFSPTMALIKSVPVVSLLLIVLFFTNKSYLSIIIVFLVISPLLYENILNGLENIDRRKLDLAKIYSLPVRTVLRYIYAPTIIERVLFSLVMAGGVGIKAAITAEVISGSSDGLGNLLYMAKISFEMVDLIAVTIVIVVSSYLIEKFFKFLLKKWKNTND